MFFREKSSGRYKYLQVVHNERADGRVRQRVIATLGRLDVLKKTGQVDRLISSGARFAQYTAVLDAYRKGEAQAAEKVKIGPSLVFEKLWRELRVPQAIRRACRNRKFAFSLERAIFLTVLHRLFDPGSDRAAEVWRDDYMIKGAENLQLYQLYRSMGWLGEPLGRSEQFSATRFSPRCTKDKIEETLFDNRRDLFSTFDIVFFDTTSIYFQGRGGKEIGRPGNIKDHRPDLKQMIVGAVLDNTGRPICCELWPGNTTDVKSLIPVVDRLKACFDIRRICVVADRGMISKETITQLRATNRDVHYILGARMRSRKEVAEQVLSRGGRFKEVYGRKETSKDPSPLKVKEVFVEDRRYIVCYNEDQAKKDREDREAILQSLKDKLPRGQKSLVGNKGYRKYLKSRRGGVFEIDKQKIKQEARLDGKWVLQTDVERMPAGEVALKYKELWMVEAVFRDIKSVLETRPIYHRLDETIRGHVFCSFLALMVLKELLKKMADRGWKPEWERLKRDLHSLEDITVRNSGRTFTIRTSTRGDAGKALQAAGVKLGPTVRFSDAETS